MTVLLVAPQGHMLADHLRSQGHGVVVVTGIDTALVMARVGTRFDEIIAVEPEHVKTLRRAGIPARVGLLAVA